MRIATETGSDICCSRILNSILEKNSGKELATAVFRLPFSGKTWLISGPALSFSSLENIHRTSPGFVVHPFDPEFSGEKPLYIKGHTLIDLSSPDLPHEEGSYRFSLPSFTELPGEVMNYPDTVRTAKERIAGETLKKVVLARKTRIPFKNDFDLWDIFALVSREFPEAFVSLSILPGNKVWLGASPELLASQDRNGIFRTMALAGTRTFNENTPPEQTDWKQKEIEEQALVSRYIINCFKSLRLREFEEDGPRTVRAGDLVHLRTDFWVDLKEVRFPDLLEKMTKLLHPTSAVCGMPREEALDFIRKHERMDRGLYAGFLGPVNLQNETALFVNLRCARLFRDHAEVFAGAGITGFSEPEAEWKETELKMAVLGKLLQI